MINWCVNKIILSGFKWKVYVNTINACTFNAWMFFYILYGGPCDFRRKFFSDFESVIKNLNQPPETRNYVPANVPIFMNPRKLGPTKINDFTVSDHTAKLSNITRQINSELSYLTSYGSNVPD